jgi:hypothetical protein
MGNGVIDDEEDVVGQQHKQQQQVGYGDPMRRRLHKSGGIGMGNVRRHETSPHPLPK